jgi:hypothetical protein
MVTKFPKFSQGLAQDPTTRRLWYGIATAHDFESHDGITEETVDFKNHTWAHPTTDNLRDLKNYFSEENVESLHTEKEPNVNLSKFLDLSWRGIFINNKK